MVSLQVNYINGTDSVGDNCTAQGGSCKNCIGNILYQEQFVSGLFLYWEQIILVHFVPRTICVKNKIGGNIFLTVIKKSLKTLLKLLDVSSFA